MIKSFITDDSLSLEDSESLVEVLIYERIGLFLLRQLQVAYSDDEFQFKNKCLKLAEIIELDFSYFKRQLGDNVQLEKIQPGKSAEILKIIWLCQMPYEMFHTMHETVLMAMKELSDYYNKPQN